MAIRWTHWAHWAHWLRRLACCGLVFACASAEAEGGRGGEWAQWGRDGSRNMASDEVGLPASFDPGTRSPDGSAIDMASTRGVRWVVQLGSHTYGNPVVAGGKVIVGTNDAKIEDPRFKPTGGGLILCVDAATGKRVWQLPVPRLLVADTPFAKPPFGGAQGPQFVAGGAGGKGGVKLSTEKLNLGICSSATVAGERVYVVSNRGEVLCLDIRGQNDGNDGPFRDEGGGGGKWPAPVSDESWLHQGERGGGPAAPGVLCQKGRWLRPAAAPGCAVTSVSSSWSAEIDARFLSPFVADGRTISAACLAGVGGHDEKRLVATTVCGVSCRDRGPHSNKRKGLGRMKIYVGNLTYSVTADVLEQTFSQHGSVEDVHVPTDRESGRPRGFAFVTMPNDQEAQAAIAALNGQDLEGRAMNVNEARPRTDGGGGRGRGGRGGGGGGGRRW